MPWRRLIITVLIIAPILALLAFGFTRDAQVHHFAFVGQTGDTVHRDAL